jgi:hypothetical protein
MDHFAKCSLRQKKREKSKNTQKNKNIKKAERVPLKTSRIIGCEIIIKGEIMQKGNFVFFLFFVVMPRWWAFKRNEESDGRPKNRLEYDTATITTGQIQLHTS